MSNINVTDKYINMIEAFECDLSLASEQPKNINRLKELIENKDKFVLRDIKLLEELSFNLRHNKYKIVEVEDDNSTCNKN